MAYTQFGGDILPIEVNHFDGTGKFIITGQLGDVMKESASIALDYLKANKEKYGLDDNAFDKQDIHIHVPEGAIKKMVHQQVSPLQLQSIQLLQINL